MLLIPYYTTVFRGQSQNRWYKTVMSAAMLLNKTIKQHTKPTGQRHSIFYFTYALLFRYSESTDLYFTQFKLKYCQFRSMVVRLKWKWLPRILSHEGERVLKKERWRSKDVLKKDSSCVHKRN